MIKKPRSTRGFRGPRMTYETHLSSPRMVGLQIMLLRSGMVFKRMILRPDALNLAKSKKVQLTKHMNSRIIIQDETDSSLPMQHFERLKKPIA